MKRSYLLTAVALVAISTAPASAAIVSLADNVDLSNDDYTVDLGSGTTYTFSYTAGSFSPVSIAMTGEAEVFGNGFFSPNAPDPLQIGATVPQQLSLGEFFRQAGTQAIPYSIAIVNVALRFNARGQTYYGYAQVGGSYLTQFAYNDTPNGSIATGELPSAVPEPISWAMMVGGFGAIGATVRRRRRVSVSFS